MTKPMPEESHNAAAPHVESGYRLHAAVRTLLSPGIWLVLAAQAALVFSLQWRVSATATTQESILPVFLATVTLMLFFYLQTGAFYALTRDRNTLSAAEVVRAGKAVFAPFLWLILKASLLFAVMTNAFIFIALLITGYNLKSLVTALVPYFDPMIGLVTFVFIYWLPWVFTRREFRLLPSLKSALRIARTRLPRSTFLALLVLAPALVSGLIPADSPMFLDLLLSVASSVMGWIAYVYCAEVLQDTPPDLDNSKSG